VGAKGRKTKDGGIDCRVGTGEAERRIGKEVCRRKRGRKDIEIDYAGMGEEGGMRGGGAGGRLEER
jgi:hypothetical protein